MTLIRPRRPSRIDFFYDNATDVVVTRSLSIRIYEYEYTYALYGVIRVPTSRTHARARHQRTGIQYNVYTPAQRRSCARVLSRAVALCGDTFKWKKCFGNTTAITYPFRFRLSDHYDATIAAGRSTSSKTMTRTCNIKNTLGWSFAKSKIIATLERGDVVLVGISTGKIV